MNDEIFIGQECVCPDGVGRVAAIVPCVTRMKGHESVRVDTYINNRSCEWARHNVRLVPLKLEPRRLP